MKTKILFFLPVFIILFCCFSCEKTPEQTTTDTPETPADTTETPTDTLNVYPKIIETADIRRYNSRFDFCSEVYGTMYPNTLYVINSEEKFTYYYTCEDSSQIDFNQKTLLCVFSRTRQGISGIATELVAQSNTAYLLKVDLKLNSTAVAQDWTVTIVTDKINTDTVKLEINELKYWK